MKYPAVRHHLNGSFVLDDLSTIEVFDPSEGSVISSVPLSSQLDVLRLSG